MTLLTIEEIDDIRQSPRAFVDIQTVEVLSDTAMYQDMQIKMLSLETNHLKAENARLRAALQEIADEIKAKHPVVIAQEALKGQQ